MIYLIAFVVCVLAAARFTRAFNIDEISARLRAWIIGRYGEASKPGKLARCYWCAGFWISGLTVVYANVALAAAGVVSWLTLAGLPLTVAAVAYASAWILDKEEGQ